MPFNVRKPKPIQNVVSILRTATAEELSAYEQYQEQKRKTIINDDKIEVVKPGQPKVDPGPSLNLFIPIKKELEAYNNYISRSSEENFQGEKIDLVEAGTIRMDVAADIFNRDAKRVPSKAAVQNQVSKRNFLK